MADALRRRARGSSPQAQGQAGEDLAHRFLRRQGCTVIARNYRPRSGGVEIDLVAWHGPALVFVEVKTRASDEFGTPDRAVDAAKRLYLLRAAEDYTRRRSIPWELVRFDIVAVTLGRSPHIEWRRDAFRTDSAARY
jgi:putative endonuclease